MRFTLYFRGELKSNGGPREKQALRRHFHAQFRELWQHQPLRARTESLLDDTRSDKSLNVLQQVGSFVFAPIVCAKTSLVAELDITLLRPQAPGALVGSGGDIDNRIKTLLDSLRVPKETNALPAGDVPGADETPFYCLLEDDKLVTALSVRTDRLLEPGLAPNEVLVLLGVTTRHIDVLIATIGLGS